MKMKKWEDNSDLLLASPSHYITMYYRVVQVHPLANISIAQYFYSPTSFGMR